jgi:hypothetical protein
VKCHAIEADTTACRRQRRPTLPRAGLREPNDRATQLNSRLVARAVLWVRPTVRRPL